MIVRTITSGHDWTFGNGTSNYLSNNDAVVQSINTRLYSVLGDCFYSLSSGIDWFNLLGGKNITALQLAVNNCILSTTGVTTVLELNLVLNLDRSVTITYQVVTVYSQNQSTQGAVTLGGFNA